MKRSCSLPNCSARHFGKGYCQKHYLRVRRTGDHDTVRAGHRFTAQDLAQRLASRSERDGTCLIYRAGHAARSGHVMIGRDGGYVGVHVAAWELANGPVPDGLVVRHRCDRPRCIELDCLQLGTIADNNRDRDERGRHVPLLGTRNGWAKLNDDAVRDIRAWSAAGEPQRVIAARLGVSQRTVWSVLSGRTWSHVPDLAVKVPS